MWRILSGGIDAHNCHSRGRRLRFEQCEDRRMLATLADIVFLVDESNSGQTGFTKIWLDDTMPLLEAAFDPSENDIDARFGLVGFGNLVRSYGHSLIVDSSVSFTSPEALFGTGEQLITAIGNLDNDGGREDGWDAIEHAIAEYNFREGAVPVFVLVQNEEGRLNWLNKPLTRDGTLAALESKSVLLNSLVVGPNIDNDHTKKMEPLFDLSPYEVTSGDFSSRRILGVEADQADGLIDGQHDYYLINTGTGTLVTNKPQTQSDTLQISYNGSNTGSSGMISSRKSILIGQDFTDGIGGSESGDSPYRAKNVPFAMVDMSAGTTQASNFSTPIAFDFSFYGQAYTELRVRQDGVIAFSATNPGGIRRPLLFFRSGYALTPEQQRPLNPRSSHSGWYIVRGKARANRTFGARLLGHSPAGATSWARCP